MGMYDDPGGSSPSYFVLQGQLDDEIRKLESQREVSAVFVELAWLMV